MNQKQLYSQQRNDLTKINSNINYTYIKKTAKKKRKNILKFLMPTTKSSNYKPGSNISKVLETENIQ
jgi:hypothetical protein